MCVVPARRTGRVRRSQRRRRRQGRRRVAGRRSQRGVVARLPRPPPPAGRQRRPRQGQGPARAPRRVARDQGSGGHDRQGSVHRRGARRAVPPRRPVSGGGRRARRPRQRQVPLQQAPGADLRRAGRARRGALAQARAAADGRRRSGRVPERRQEHVDQRDLGRQAEDRRLPVHDTRAEPRRGGARRRHQLRGRRHPGSDRGRQRGPRPRTSVPSPHRARPGAVPVDRSRLARRSRASRAGADPAARAGRYRPDLLERPRIVVGTKADVVRPEDLDRSVGASR